MIRKNCSIYSVNERSSVSGLSSIQYYSRKGIDQSIFPEEFLQIRERTTYLLTMLFANLITSGLSNDPCDTANIGFIIDDHSSLPPLLAAIFETVRLYSKQFSVRRQFTYPLRYELVQTFLLRIAYLRLSRAFTTLDIPTSAQFLTNTHTHSYEIPHFCTCAMRNKRTHRFFSLNKNSSRVHERRLATICHFVGKMCSTYANMDDVCNQ